MSQAAHRLVNSLDASGFGLPFQMSQFTSRVEAVGLFGAELLASHKQGLKAVVKRFNDAQYLCMKRALGASTKMSIGCHVKVLLECRQSCRLGSRFLERVILLKSRIQCLPTFFFLRSQPMSVDEGLSYGHRHPAGSQKEEDRDAHEGPRCFSSPRLFTTQPHARPNKQPQE